jgi:capsular exopolysaccharide synthesis family protein
MTSEPVGISSGPLPVDRAVPRIDLLSLLRLLNRRKWVVVGVTLSAVAVAALLVSQLTAEYRSGGTLLVESRNARSGAAAELLAGLVGEPPTTQNEVEILRSTGQLGRIVDRLDLANDPEFGGPRPGRLAGIVGDLRALFAGWRQDARQREAQGSDEAPRTRAILILSRTLVINTGGRASVIAISADSTDPEKARRLVSTTMELYIDQQFQARAETTKRLLEQVNLRAEELRKQLAETEAAAAAMRQKAGISRSDETPIASQSLAEINSQLAQARALRADKESRIAALQRAQKDPATTGGVAEVLASPVIGALRGQEAELSRRLGDLNERYGPDHPKLKQVNGELSQIRGRIAAEASKILASLQTDADAAKAKEEQLQAEVEQLMKQATGVGWAEANARRVERDAQSLRALYDQYVKRAKALQEQLDIQQPDARILSPATLPTSPIFPRTGVIMAMALAGGLLLSFAAIGALERLDRSLRTGDEVERLIGLPSLGMVPQVARSLCAGRMPAQYGVANPTSVYSAALRSVHTTLMLQMRNDPPKVILVTSALPDEGKSTFAVSLAALVAAQDREARVIVVDCDLQASTVAQALGQEPTVATIQDFLSGERPLGALLGKEPESGLYYVTAHSNTEHCAEFFDSRGMRRFIDALRHTFDLIVLDVPPVMADSDARLIGQLADYIALVVRWEGTPREMVANAAKLMRTVGKPMGCVLTRVDLARHARFGFGDDAYYYSKYQQSYRQRGRLRRKARRARDED